MGLPPLIDALRKAARAPFSSTDSACQKFFTSPANTRGESPCPVLTSKERCETLYGAAHGGFGDCNCYSNRDFFKIASACLTCRSIFAPVPACRTASYTPSHPENSHIAQEAMKPADVPKWAVRDSGDNIDLASASQSSGWTVAQVLTPVVIVVTLCLAFVLWLLYQRGRLSRSTSLLPSMQRRRQGLTPRRWSFDIDAPNGGPLPYVPDAEATPMIDPLLHSRSLSHDDTADRQRPSPRMRTGILTAAFSKAIHSIRRLFGWGPIRVSRVPVPDTFDLEDPVAETDSNTSKSWRSGFPSVGRNSGSMVYGIPSTHNLANGSSAALEPVLDNGREETGNVFEDGGAEDHDNGMDARNGVMLISRNGEDFSLSGSMVSAPFGKRSVEVDRRSTEVVPPTPTVDKQMNRSQLHDPRATRDQLASQPFHQSPSVARSASTPPLFPSSSEKSLMRHFAPSTNNLSNFSVHPLPKLPTISPTHVSTRPAAPSSVQRSREDAPGVYHYTTVTPPLDSAGPSYRSPKMAPPSPLPPDAHSLYSHLGPEGYSSALSLDLQNYIPSFLGRSPPRSPYLLPSPVPSSQVHESDPQNMVPSAVRAAGYNPFQHSRSASTFE